MSTSTQYKNYHHYLTDGWSKEPKEMFKFLAEQMKTLPLISGQKVLDIGCATGELIHSLRAMESRRRGRVVPGSLRAGCFSAGKI